MSIFSDLTSPLKKVEQLREGAKAAPEAIKETATKVGYARPKEFASPSMITGTKEEVKAAAPKTQSLIPDYSITGAEWEADMMKSIPKTPKLPSLPPVGTASLEESAKNLEYTFESAAKGFTESLSKVTFGQMDNSLEERKTQAFDVANLSLRMVDGEIAAKREFEYQAAKNHIGGMSAVEKTLLYAASPEYRMFENLRNYGSEAGMETYALYEKQLELYNPQMSGGIHYNTLDRFSGGAMTDSLVGATEIGLEIGQTAIDKATEKPKQLFKAVDALTYELYPEEGGLASATAKAGITTYGYYIDILERPWRKYGAPTFNTGVNNIISMVEAAKDGRYPSMDEFDRNRKMGEYWAGGSMDALPRLAKAIFGSDEDKVAAIDELIETETKFREGMREEYPWLQMMEELEIYPGIPAIAVADTITSLTASITEGLMGGAVVKFGAGLATMSSTTLPISKFWGNIFMKGGGAMIGMSQSVYPVSGAVALTKGGFVGDDAANWYKEQAKLDSNFAQDSSVMEGMFYLGGLLKGLGLGTKFTVKQISNGIDALNKNPALVKTTMGWFSKKLGTQIEYMYKANSGEAGKMRVTDLLNLKEAWNKLPEWQKARLQELRVVLTYAQAKDSKVAGEYDPLKGEIKVNLDAARVKQKAGMEMSKIVSHELGHYLQKLMPPSLDKAWKKAIKGITFETELKPQTQLKAQTEPTKFYSDTYKLSSPGEMYAEAIQLYNLNPKKLLEEFPTIWKFMDNLNKKFYGQLAGAKEAMKLPNLPKIETPKTTNKGLVDIPSEFMPRIDPKDDSLAKLGEDFKESNLSSKMHDKKTGKNKFWQWASYQVFGQFEPLKTYEETLQKGGSYKDIIEGTKLNDELAANPLDFANSSYFGARMFTGWQGEVLDIFQGKLEPIIKDVGKGVDNLNKLMHIQRAMERIKNGIDKNPWGRTIENYQKLDMELKQTQGAEGYAKLEDAATKIRGIMDGLLQQARDTGLISKEGYKNIVAKNQFYSPFEVLEYELKQGEGLGGKKSLNMTNSDAIKAQVGTTKAVADPLPAVVRHIIQMKNAIERNKVMEKFIGLTKQFPKAEQDIIKMGPGDKMPVDYGMVSVYKDGIKEDYAVPKVLGEVIKQLNGVQTNFVDKVAKLQSGWLRKGATQLNLSFGTGNVIRDYFYAKFVSEHSMNLVDWAKGLFIAAAHEAPDFVPGAKWADTVYSDWLKSGSSMSGYFQMGQGKVPTVEELKSGKGNNLAEGIIKDMSQGGLEKLKNKPWKVLTSPLDLIGAINELTESATRLANFEKAREGGTLGSYQVPDAIAKIFPSWKSFEPESISKAGYTAKAGTIDFSKMGSTARVINMWVPFINARWQGYLGIVDAFKTHPARSMKIISGLSVPVVATVVYNRTYFPDMVDKIPDWIKNYAINIILYKKIDDEGEEVPVYLSIPKGDVMQVFGNMAEDVTNYAYDGKMSGNESAHKLWKGFTNLLPVDIASDDEWIDINQAATSLIPPFAKAIIEGAQNKNFFRDKDIVPRNIKRDPNAPGEPSVDLSPSEQYNYNTPPGAVLASQALSGINIEVSPMILENFAGTAFGGLGRQFLDPEKFITDPIGRFFKEGYPQEQEEQYEERSEIKTAIGDKKIQLQQRVVDYRKTMEGKTPAQVEEELVEIEKGDPGFTELFGKIQDKGSEDMTSFERALESDSAEVRAIYIKQQLDELPEEEWQAFVDDYTEKGIINSAVKKEILAKKPNIKNTQFPEGGDDKYRDKDQPFIDEFMAAWDLGAFTSDPVIALQTLLSEEQIRKTENGVFILKRMRTSESEAVKAKGGATGDDILDHTVPIELGGDNSDGNLIIVTNEEWKSYTPLENHLGRLVYAGKLGKPEAGDLIKKFKNGEIDAATVLATGVEPDYSYLFKPTQEETDKDLKGLLSDNGEKATAIVEYINSLPPEEQQAELERLMETNVITTYKPVREQLAEQLPEYSNLFY